jgi:hypothetical protein
MLEASIADARTVADRFNATASKSHIEVYVMVGRVAQDDVEAARAIGSEVRDLINQMQAGIANASPEAIREAANKARNLRTMLSAEVAGQVSAAIIEARKAAREIVSRVEKAGEPAAQVVAELSTERLKSARFAFLDLDESDAPEVQHEAPTGRVVDLEADSAPSLSAASVENRTLDLI